MIHLSPCPLGPRGIQPKRLPLSSVVKRNESKGWTEDITPPVRMHSAKAHHVASSIHKCGN
ncbi:hypothetical protein Hanom_Chr03g00181901 [Helianthus anomalus]